MEPFGKINLSEQQLQNIITPCYVVNEVKLEENLKILKRVQQEANCRILLALKGFAMWSLFPLIRRYLQGVTASSINEALLGRKEFGKEVHIYAPAYSEKEMDRILSITDHISFNSTGQWKKYKPFVQAHKAKISAGVRINPEHSEVSTPIYDPCAPYSRMGITIENFNKELNELQGIEGLHFHNLCELNSDSLEHTLKAVEEKFGFYFNNIKWINFGGGHHITRADYNVDHLIRLIKDFKTRYDLEVYLEPGEAIGLNTGVLVSKVMDVFENKMPIAILDTSATAHIPDVLEMPYRPAILGGGEPGEKPYTYRLGGLTCLAGDVIGDYSFNQPLKEGDALIFGDMAHYTMVKNTTFNGIHLPAIYIYNSHKGELRLQRLFSYEDYKGRLS
ncbi:MAG: carboxynorspermidine decarboxylase [Bacteroidetes bacterium]|jgi:carboxynorspermidine decarboxylase|nr:carboxynorspermidine decarboxylase [Bacteroidota bacterium]